MTFEGKFRFANHTDIGKARKKNEDAMGFFEAPNGNGYVFVVCDGMGGHVGGAVASQTAIKAIRYFLEQEYISDAREAIRKALEYANQEIYYKAQTSSDLRNMGTTCVMVIYREGQCYIGHVGDSRLYLYRDGLLTRLTKDHSFVQMLVDQGVITEEEAEVHPRRNEILRALGTDLEVEVEVRPAPFTPNIKDTFLLCSDGLNSMLSDYEIESILDESRDLQDKAHLFINSANAEGGLDNITVQLIEFLVGNTPAPLPKNTNNFNPIASNKLSDTNPLGVTTSESPSDEKKKL
ncbi:MAG: Stp1/IreP family PP2C-type Ser/Thr phosphatase [Bacteroidetes bacterium]|nr:MAG: Stp1/IreP family PP2C-type Ser/Thr phosphatase [Bacteroidota bacterium]